MELKDLKKMDYDALVQMNQNNEITLSQFVMAYDEDSYTEWLEGRESTDTLAGEYLDEIERNADI